MVEAITIPSKTKHKALIQSLMKMADLGNAVNVDLSPAEARLCYAALELYHENETLASDIIRFQFRRHGDFKSLALYFETAVGWDYISLAALFGHKKTDARGKLIEACRDAISPQIRAVKNAYHLQNKTTAICAVTGHELTLERLVVDHAPPHTFIKIFEDFFEPRLLEKGKSWDDYLELLEQRNSGETWKFKLQRKSKYADRLRSLFFEYHLQKAELRLVTAAINSSLGDYSHLEANHAS